MLFVGDDWAEDHHDVEIQDETGRGLAKARLPEGTCGIARLHGLVGRFLPEDGDPAGVKIGIETDRGPWVAALVASGYQVYAVNPLQSARARQGRDVSGAKSDAGDAHVLADLVHTQSHQLRTVAEDSQDAGAVKVLARMHQSLIWDRTRLVLRLRSSLREFFPAALEAYEDLASPDVLELLTKAPEPQRGPAEPGADHRRPDPGPSPRPGSQGHRDHGRASRRAPHPAAADRGRLRRNCPRPGALITTSNEQIATLQGQVEACFGRHPDAEIYLSQPGLGSVLGARVLAEFGDDPTRYAGAGARARARARARKNYAGTSPITRASGKKTVVLARYVRNKRLTDALHHQGILRAERITGSPRLLRRCGAATSATTRPCASSATASSAFCTATSKRTPVTTSRLPGTSTPNRQQLDIQSRWDV